MIKFVLVEYAPTGIESAFDHGAKTKEMWVNVNHIAVYHPKEKLLVYIDDSRVTLTEKGHEQLQAALEGLSR